MDEAYPFNIVLEILSGTEATSALMVALVFRTTKLVHFKLDNITPISVSIAVGPVVGVKPETKWELKGEAMAI